MCVSNYQTTGEREENDETLVVGSISLSSNARVDVIRDA